MILGGSGRKLVLPLCWNSPIHMMIYNIRKQTAWTNRTNEFCSSYGPKVKLKVHGKSNTRHAVLIQSNI